MKKYTRYDEIEEVQVLQNKEFGEETATYLIHNAGIHAKVYGTTKNMGSNEDERLIFALLEIIDFQCLAHRCEIYGNIGLTEENIKNFLVKHRNTILDMKIEPPSFLGLVCGSFDFLWKTEEKQK